MKLSVLQEKNAYIIITITKIMMIINNIINIHNKTITDWPTMKG